MTKGQATSRAQMIIGKLAGVRRSMWARMGKSTESTSNGEGDLAQVIDDVAFVQLYE
jgi:hypothetical protein